MTAPSYSGVMRIVQVLPAIDDSFLGEIIYHAGESRVYMRGDDGWIASVNTPENPETTLINWSEEARIEREEYAAQRARERATRENLYQALQDIERENLQAHPLYGAF